MNENPPSIDPHTLQVQTLFVRHRQAILAYVLTLEPRLHEADEIVQECFLTATQKADAWVAGTNFMAWACALARFTTLGHQRDQGRSKRRLAPDVVELLAEQPNGSIDRFQEQLFQLRDCLKKLSPRAAQVVNLRYHAGKLPEQIASEINWTANAVRVALSRARTSLRDCLQATRETVS